MLSKTKEWGNGLKYRCTNAKFLETIRILKCSYYNRTSGRNLNFIDVLEEGKMIA